MSFHSNSSSHTSDRRFISAACRLMVVWVIALICHGCGESTTPLQQARIDWAKGNTESARRAFEDFLQAHPDDVNIRFEYAEHLSTAEPAEAIRQYDMIPDDSQLAFDAARRTYAVARQMNDLKQLDHAVQRLLKLNPDDFGVVLTAAEHYFNTKRPQPAEQYARRVVEIQPQRTKSWLLLAEILDDLGRTAEAVEPLETAKKLAPEDFSVRANLAHAYQFAGLPDKAAEEASWCLEQQPDNPAILYILASSARAQGNHDRALQLVRRAAESENNDVRIPVLEADILLYQRKAEEAYQRLKPLYPKYKDHRPFLAACARAAAASGHRDDAMRYQKRIARLIAKASDEENATAENSVP